MKETLLLEIGCENLPSGYLGPAIGHFGKIVRKGFEDERIACSSLVVTGTPNRIVLIARDVPARQASVEQRVTGPPVSAAIGPDGAFTKAAIGFARSQGMPPEKLRRVETERGSYLAAVRTIRGGSTRAVLAERLPGWIAAVRFPKTMRWDDSGFVFARPVRWVLCLLGGRPVGFELGSLAAGRCTRLSPFSTASVPVADAAAYLDLMKRERIALDPARRRASVLRSARREAKKLGGVLVEDDGLVNAVANLVESPVVMAGAFDERFLSLPREVIVTALKSHQRYFSVEDGGGRLLPSFIAFADGARRNRREIRRGYERVLHARLADAAFYFEEDTSRPLEEMAASLDRVVWLEGLGSLALKTGRIAALAGSILSNWKDDAQLARDLERAARLAKADIASEMVRDGKEFTLLQGYMGREYARASGESEAVGEAIYEHHLPRFAGDRVPETDAGALLAVADRLDTIAGLFTLGLEPSGSQDPYALRRQTLGLLRILIERGIPARLPALVREALEEIRRQGIAGPDEKLDERILGFVSNRLSVMLRDEGFDYDLVNAVLATPWEDPGTAKRMIVALGTLREAGRLDPFVLAMRRVANIIPKDRRRPAGFENGRRPVARLDLAGEEGAAFSADLFREAAEDGLFDDVRRAGERLAECERSGRLEEGYAALADTAPAVDAYFDEVLVNCPEQDIRENRIAFLQSVYTIISLYFDVTAIVVE